MQSRSNKPYGNIGFSRKCPFSNTKIIFFLNVSLCNQIIIINFIYQLIFYKVQYFHRVQTNWTPIGKNRMFISLRYNLRKKK